MDKKNSTPLLIHSFTMPCGVSKRNELLVKKACEIRHEQLQKQAAKQEQACNFKHEVVIGMNDILVNVYNASAQDVMMIGFHFNSLYTNSRS